jgi:hypothetical protein
MNADEKEGKDARKSGGKPPFLTCEMTEVEGFNQIGLTGREEGLAPARVLVFLLSYFALLSSICVHLRSSVVNFQRGFRT